MMGLLPILYYNRFCMRLHKPTCILPGKLVTVLLAIILLVAVAGLAMKSSADPVADTNLDTYADAGASAVKDSVASVTAFMQVYKVLMHPRCMNCHPKGDVPLQGNDSHLHGMYPQRGKNGKGVYAMKCSNCHQSEPMKGLSNPPGHPEWHLPPANMKMVFEGKTPSQLAKQLVNPQTNGHKDMKKLLEHADDGLVKVGWHMGEGRTPPPLSHAEFKAAWTTWIENGAYAPQE